jgi:hypothetical protein
LALAWGRAEKKDVIRPDAAKAAQLFSDPPADGAKELVKDGPEQARNQQDNGDNLLGETAAIARILGRMPGAEAIFERWPLAPLALRAEVEAWAVRPLEACRPFPYLVVGWHPCPILLHAGCIHKRDTGRTHREWLGSFLRGRESQHFTLLVPRAA